MVGTFADALWTAGGCTLEEGVGLPGSLI
jgi:hypothetical protein